MSSLRYFEEDAGEDVEARVEVGFKLKGDCLMDVRMVVVGDCSESGITTGNH